MRISGHQLTRGWRALVYRQLPALNKGFFQKKIAGYERRWNLEACGFTKQGFLELFRLKMLAGLPAGLFYEIQPGDGLVGSLGIWLEKDNPPWTVEAWEHRKIPAETFSLHRPRTVIHRSRKLQWDMAGGKKSPVGMTVRGSREASAVCRALQKGSLCPRWVGIWNPRRHPVWFFRMKKAGYRLELVYERMEFYRNIRQ